jgi:hypothetical protein
MPRSANALPASSSNNWLLAAPHTSPARNSCTDARVNTPPSAHGASTSHSAVITASGATTGTPTAAAFSASMSAITTDAPASTNSRARHAPTWPAP